MESRYKNQRVLVTGGAGVIGSVLIAELVELGAHVLCCDLKPRPASFGAGIEYIQGDANFLTLGQLSAFDPQVAFHLAATFERAVEQEEFWHENYWHNLRLSNHVMSLIKELPTVRRVVFASSYLIYDPKLYSFDTPQVSPTVLSEHTPIYPRNICGAAKLLHEFELRFLESFECHPFTTISARIFRVYGKNSRDIVSRWIRRLVGEPDAELEVYRGEGIFDYIYAGDVAMGLLRLGATGATGICNLGSGHGRSVFELIEVLRARFPRLRTTNIEIDIPYEAHEADTRYLQALTGWRPPTTLEAGVDILIRHYQGNSEALRGDEVELGVLISSASRKVPLVQRFKAALLRTHAGGRVIAGDLNGECVAGYFADATWAMPRLDALDVASLITECRARGIELIVPTRDSELAFYAEAREALAEAGIFVPTPSSDTIQACVDKQLFYQRCLAGAIPAIPTYDRLDALPNTGLCVVKERFGAGSLSIGIGLTRPEAAAHASTLRAPIFQPLVEGVEHSIDLYVNRRGEVVEVVPRRRTQVFNGESVVTETVESSALVEASVALAVDFELRGHNVLQAFVLPDESVLFIECNARVGGASTVSFEAGLDSPQWMLLEARGQYVAPRLGSYRRGLKMVRGAADHFLAP